MTYVEVGAWSETAPPTGAVVVGYNGRKHSHAALIWAAEESARRGAPLIVLFAANYPGMTLEPGPGLLEREPGALDAAYAVTAGGVQAALDHRPELTVFGATELTSPSQALVEASRHAALVVLGSRGLGRLVGALLGSVAFNVSSQAVCPVMVVRDRTHARTTGPDFPVVVGTDGSAEAQAAVGFAVDHAVSTSAALEIVTCTGGHQIENIDEQRLRPTADHIADAAASRVRQAHPRLTVTTRIEDCPAEVTLIESSADAGLVVVGTRGRGAFTGLLLGSVSHAVIDGAECTVAVVGP